MVRGTTCTWRCGTAWLTMLFSATHEPCAPSAVDHRGAAPLHRAEQRCEQLGGKLGQRHDVLPRDHEHVPLEHGADVEERDDVGLVEHDVTGLAPGGDRAEQAVAAGP